MKDTVILARLKLYHRVWSEPVTKLAREFGLSDVGFAKLCKRNEIPRPPRGYWAKIKAGHKMVVPPLPQKNMNRDILITRYEKTIEDSDLRAEAERNKAQIMEEEPIVVRSSLRGARHLVTHSLHTLAGGKITEHGIIMPASSCGCLDVNVSKSSLRRALRIMDSLIKTFEKRGYSVQVLNNQKEKGTVVELMEEQVFFGIHEILEAKNEEIGGDDDFSGRYEFQHSRFMKRTVPSGNLCLQIEPRRSYYSSRDGHRRKWSDSAKCQIEKQLNKFVVGVIRVAIARRETRLANERREREYREEAERQERERQQEEQARAKQEAKRAAMWAKIQAERAKVDTLETDAAAWEESVRIRAYIEASREDAVNRGKDVREDSDTGKWLQWAERQADRLDPFKESPPSILDDEGKYRKRQ